MSFYCEHAYSVFLCVTCESTVCHICAKHVMQYICRSYLVPIHFRCKVCMSVCVRIHSYPIVCRHDSTASLCRLLEEAALVPSHTLDLCAHIHTCMRTHTHIHHRTITESYIPVMSLLGHVSTKPMCVCVCGDVCMCVCACVFTTQYGHQY